MHAPISLPFTYHLIIIHTDQQPIHIYDYITYNQSHPTQPLSTDLNNKCTEGSDTADVELLVGRYGVTEVEVGEVRKRRAVGVAGEGVHDDGRREMSGGEVEEEGHVVPECNHGATCGSTEAAQQECSLELVGSEVVHEYDVAVVKYESVPWDLYESVPWVSYESVQHNYETIWNGYERITCDYYEKVGDGYQDGYEVFQDGYKVVHNGYESVGDDYEVVRDDYAVVRDDYEVVRDDYAVVRDDYEVVRDDYNAAQHTYEAVLDGHDEL